MEYKNIFASSGRYFGRPPLQMVKKKLARGLRNYCSCGNQSARFWDWKIRPLEETLYWGDYNNTRFYAISWREKKKKTQKALRNPKKSQKRH